MPDDLTRSLDLMKRAQGGDRDALERLMARYYERVRPIVRARLGRKLRKRVDSGDILQQTFEQAFRTYDRFEVNDEASLIGWLARIAERQIHDEFDKQSAKKRGDGAEVALDPGSTGGKAGALPADSADDPARPLEVKEQAEVLDDCLCDLSDLHRELILLRHYEGHSWEKVAEETRRPSADAARMMYAQALIQLGILVKARMNQ